jgi:LAO/AO transport system kinase
MNHKPKSALHLQDGVEQPSAVNPHFDFSTVRQSAQLTSDDYIQGILNGDRMYLGKSITLIESSLEKHHPLANAILEACLPYAGKSIRIGITGVPGAGKSTFIEAFGKYLTSQGKKVAVLAIDPSSGRSKGSILGDKTRMEALANDPNAFIRPSPSAGTLGGVARKTAETLILCEAAGFDTVIVETVGVGQSETEVKNMVDFFLLLMIAGAGDELQGIKRGIMEMADAILINKADGDNILKAELARSQIRNALQLFPPAVSGWKPSALTVSALQKTGMIEVWQMIENYRQWTLDNDYFMQNRIRQQQERLHRFLREQLYDTFLSDETVQAEIRMMETRLQAQTISVYAAAREVLEMYRKKNHL